MTTPVAECPACRVQMQAGFVLDVGHNGRMGRTRWTEGVPRKSLLRGLTVEGRLLETTTFRRSKCGWLIWFAPEPIESGE